MWSFSKARPEDRVLTGLLARSALFAPLPPVAPADVGSAEADALVLRNATIDRDVFVAQALALQRALPHVTFSFAISRGADGPPVVSGGVYVSRNSRGANATRTLTNNPSLFSPFRLSIYRWCLT